MNKLIIALSLACASACVFADQKISTNDWFNASAETGASVVSDGSSWSTTPTVSGNKYVIESEIDSPVTFSSAVATAAGDFTEVSFKLDTTIVPADARAEADLSTRSAKVAFAASEDDNGRAYYAWLGATKGWTKLAGATPSEEDGTPYELVVTFDQNANKVQFKVDGTPLTLDDSAVIDYNAGVSTQVSIDFVGNGNVAYLKGNQQTIEAEVIVDGGITIDIKEDDVKKFDMGTDTPAQFFAANASEKIKDFTATGISVATAYAVGLLDADMKPVNGGALVASAVAESTDAEKITFKLNAASRDSKDTGVTVRYQIFNVTDNSTSEGLSVPKAKAVGLKKYKVQAIVEQAQ